MIVIWAVLGVVLVVMVLGGFVGRARAQRRREDEALEAGRHPHANQPHHSSHGGRARRSRGRGRGRQRHRA